jgi:GDP-D-mannose 3',5'-epimerase
VAVAVLGAGGFIGSRVAEALIERGEEVLVVSHSVPTHERRLRAWESASHRALADLRDEAVDLQGCHQVFNFAADMGGVGYFSQAQVGPYITNSRITFNVLEMAGVQKVSALFMASSACAYPIDLQQTPGRAPELTEDLLERGPADQMYGREKLMLCVLGQQVDFDCRVGILHTIYGDAESSSWTKMKFPTAIARKALEARENGVIRVWGDGSQLRSYLWIDDAVNKILCVMRGENPGPINIGRQGAISVREIVEICCQHLGIAPEIVFDPSAPSGVLSRDCSNNKFWSIYGEMEPTDYRTGFGWLIDDIAVSEATLQKTSEALHPRKDLSEA